MTRRGIVVHVERLFACWPSEGGRNFWALLQRPSGRGNASEMAHTAAARAFEDLDGMLGSVDWLHSADLRSVPVWAMDRVAAATVRRAVGQPRRDVSRRYRHRSKPPCRCAFAAPSGDVVVEARPPQPIIISQPSSYFSGPSPSPLTIMLFFHPDRLRLKHEAVDGCLRPSVREISTMRASAPGSRCWTTGLRSPS